jgi:hypothetical protein
MNSKLILTLAIAASVVVLGGVGPEVVADAPLDMDLIITAANAEICDHDYSDASATIQIDEKNDGTTEITIAVRKAKPNHLYTAWIKVAGTSPISGAGATPAAATSDIDTIIDNADSASDDGANAFYTNSAGNATVHITLDFHLSDGVYPFSAYDDSYSDVSIGDTPFTFRVISHCTDDEQHGVYPGVHEPTFQISL